MWNNPVRYNDPDGNCPLCIPFLIALFEIGSSAADVHEVATTVTDPEASTGDKIKTVALAGAGLLLPGGGYSKVDDAVDGAKNLSKKFNGKNSTESVTDRASYRKAKDQNGIPRSQQPDKTIKPNTPEGDKAGLDSRNIRQDEFTNSYGEKVSIRKDKPAKYGDGGKGDQGTHYNAGSSGEKLKQHHNINN